MRGERYLGVPILSPGLVKPASYPIGPWDICLSLVWIKFWIFLVKFHRNTDLVRHVKLKLFNMLIKVDCFDLSTVTAGIRMWATLCLWLGQIPWQNAGHPIPYLSFTSTFIIRAKFLLLLFLQVENKIHLHKGALKLCFAEPLQWPLPSFRVASWWRSEGKC